MQNLHYSFCCIAPKLRSSKATKMMSNHRGMTMFTDLKTRYNRWVRYKQTLNELSALSGRELADLGITRHDIRKLAREASRT